MRSEDPGTLFRTAGQKRFSSAACVIRFDVEAAGPFEFRTLNRVMDQISSDHGVFSPRPNSHAHVPRRVAGRWLQLDLIGQPVIGFDEVDEACNHDRLNRIEYDVSVVCGRGIRPVLPFGPSKEIARSREGRDPTLIGPSGIPSNVVYMEMSTDDGVDRIDRKACCLHIR